MQIVTDNLIAAIDPGDNGALAIIDYGGKTRLLIDLPTVAKPTSKKDGKTKKQIDVCALATILREWAPRHIIVEQVHSMPRQGVASSFKFGRTVGQIEGLAVGIGAQLSHLTPQSWKGHHNLLGTSKDTARLYAISLLPNMADKLKRKKDVDRADALLMAHTFLDRLISASDGLITEASLKDRRVHKARL